MLGSKCRSCPNDKTLLSQVIRIPVQVNIMNNSKCNECGLVNPAGGQACRRCGAMLGMPVRKAVAEEKTKSHRYLFVVAFLLLALGLGSWYGLKKGAVDSIHLVEDKANELVPDKRVTRKEPAIVPKPPGFIDHNSPERKEALQKQLKERDWTPYVPRLSAETIAESTKAQEEAEKNRQLQEEYRHRERTRY